VFIDKSMRLEHANDVISDRLYPFFIKQAPEEEIAIIGKF
jgi:hypothetical protein